MIRRVRELSRVQVRTADDQACGIEQVMIDDEHWAVRYLVVDIGRWIGARRLLVSPVAVVRNADDTLTIHASKDALRNSPGIDPDSPIGRDEEIMLHKYYSWPYYWEYPSYLGSTKALLYSSPAFAAGRGKALARFGSRAAAALTQAHPVHLHTSRSLAGCSVLARNEEAGRVEDLLVDDQAWAVRYLVIDVGHLPVKRVLFSPHWMRGVDWDEREVYLDVAMEAVRNGPDYDGETPVDRDYETRLHDYYRRPGYWKR